MIRIGDIETRLADLERIFRKIDTTFLTKSIKQHSQLIADRAKQIVAAHHRTGALERAPSVNPGRKHGRYAQVAVGLRGYETTQRVTNPGTGETVTRKIVPWRYGKFLEHGFRHTRSGREIPADPFMGPAFDQTVDEVVNRVRADVQRELDR